MSAGRLRSALTAGLLAGLAGTATAQAASPRAPDLDAIVSHETRHVMANGVTRTDTWQERIVRRGETVWLERAMPAARSGKHDDETATEHIGHRHFNADTSARWLSRSADGSVTLKLVDREHQAVVAVPRAEFGTVGFDGRFDAAASVLPTSAVRSMKAGAVNDQGQWFSDRSDGWSHRVLWSEARQLAMRVESQRDDGSVKRVVSVRLMPAAALPWAGLQGFAAKHYDDFMD
jgi:hypothetical protein